MLGVNAWKYFQNPKQNQKKKKKQYVWFVYVHSQK